MKPYDVSAEPALTFFKNTDCSDQSGLIKLDNELTVTMITSDEFYFEHDIHFKDSETGSVLFGLPRKPHLRPPGHIVLGYQS